MNQNIFKTLLVATALTLGGCGSDDGDICAVQASMDLDEGNFTAVIDALENNQTCNGVLTKEEAWMNVGAAYIGTAGISIGKIMGVVADMADSSAELDMGSISTTFEDAGTSQGLNALTKAQKVYGYILGDADCSDTGSLSTAYEEAGCVYKTLADTLKMVGVINASLGGVADLLGSLDGEITDVNSNGVQDELDVTACAISKNDAGDGLCTGITIVASIPADVNFSDGDGYSGVYNPKIYEVVRDANHTDSNQSIFYRTLDSTWGTPATTLGKCTSDLLVSCDTINYTATGTGCYECPVILDGESLSVTTGILDVINADDSSIPEGVLSEFDTDGDGNVSEEELANAIADF